MSNYAPPTTPMGYSPGPQPPPKKSKVWIWVLAGCGSFVLLGVIVVMVGGFFIWNKAKEAGFDPELMEKNPAMAAAKIIAATNPDIEVVSTNDAKGTITLREKKTGKTITINLEDARSGRISFQQEGEDPVTIEAQGEGGSGSVEMKSSEGTAKFGGGALEEVPDWLPEYPGVTIQGNFSMKGTDKSAGHFTFTTQDSIEQVVSFFNDNLTAAGLNVRRNVMQQDGKTSLGTVTGQDAEKKRTAAMTAIAGDKGTQVSVSFEVKN